VSVGVGLGSVVMAFFFYFPSVVHLVMFSSYGRLFDGLSCSSDRDGRGGR
jgi:hypothetical protein